MPGDENIFTKALLVVSVARQGNGRDLTKWYLLFLVQGAFQAGRFSPFGFEELLV